MTLYSEYFDDLVNQFNSKNELNAINGQFFAASQLLKLHLDANQRENPIIVELGVEKGASTKTFLNAISNKAYATLKRRVHFKLLDLILGVLFLLWIEFTRQLLFITIKEIVPKEKG